MRESWKPAVGWEGVYDVSDLGRVRRIKTYFKTRPAPYEIALGKSSNGYLTVQLCDGLRKPKHFTVHRLIAAAFLGPCPAGHEVNHIDRDRANNRVDNLEYTTHHGNVNHSYQFSERMANVSRGMAHVHRVLADDDVLAIRARLGQGATLRGLAAEYSVGFVTIFDIKHRKTWAHI